MIADLTGSQREILLRLGIGHADSLLDIGCGNGEKTFCVSNLVRRIVGIDPDEKLIHAAQNTFVRDNLSFKVDRAESLNFPAASFTVVLFNESLHHVPANNQSDALSEAWRVLEPEGRALVAEPIYGRGSFEAILKFYHEEREPRQCAIKAIESSLKGQFKLAAKEEIRVEYSCKGFDDLYQNEIEINPYAYWNDVNRQEIIDLLQHCDKTPGGDFIIDYYESVWLLIKR